MIHYQSTDQIRAGLSDAVEETTGIYIAPKEFHVEINQDTLSIYVHQSHLANIAIDPEDWSADDVGWGLVDTLHDLRHRLVELKIEEISTWMEEDLQHIQDFMSRQIKAFALQIQPDIEICALEYDPQDWSGEEESEERVPEGYPPLAIHITDYDRFKFYFRINPYEPGWLFNPDQLFEDLLMYIKTYLAEVSSHATGSTAN